MTIDEWNKQKVTIKKEQPKETKKNKQVLTIYTQPSLFDEQLNNQTEQKS